MKTFLLLLLCLISLHHLSAQNVGIGTNNPNAKLDITSSDDGLLIPRVSLTGTTDITTVPNRTTSELIYNTASANDVTSGYYYWNGSSWERLLIGADAVDDDIQNQAVDNAFGTGQSASFDITGNGEIGGAFNINGNVGIGTVTPSSKLTVSNGERADITLKTSDNANSQGIAFQNSGDSYTWNIYRKDVGSFNADLVFANGVDSDITALTDVVTFENGGNVGIGIDDPSATLDVVGTFQLEDGTQAMGNVLISDASGNASWSSDLPANDGDYIWNQNTTDQVANFRINGTGVIGPNSGGIGNSTFKIANSTTDYMNFDFGNSGSGQFQFNGWSNGWAMGTKTDGKHLYINIGAGNNSDVYIGTLGNELFVDGANGQLGIGTYAPNNLLDFETAGGIQLENSEYTNTSDEDGVLFYDKNYYGTGEPGDGHFNNDGGGLAIKDEDGWGAIVSTSNMQWLEMDLSSLHIGGTSDPGNDNLIVDGTVGIGTSSPSATLDVVGTFQLEDGTEAAGSVLTSDASGNAAWSNDIPDNDVGYIWNQNSADQSADFRIDGTAVIGANSGGAGTSTLKIASSATDFASFEFGASGMGELEFVGWANGWNMSTKTNGKHLYINRAAGANSDVYIGTSGNELFVDGANGRVGIGTYSPSEKLSVHPNQDESAEIGRAHIGNMGFSDWAGFSHVDQNGTNTYALLQSASGGTKVNAKDGQNIFLAISNTNHIEIEGDGDLEMLDDNIIKMTNNMVTLHDTDEWFEASIDAESGWTAVSDWTDYLDVESGQKVIVQMTTRATIAGISPGTNNDELEFRFRMGGASGCSSKDGNSTGLIQGTPEDDFVMISHIDVLTVNCNGRYRFKLEANADVPDLPFGVDDTRIVATLY